MSQRIDRRPGSRARSAWARAFAYTPGAPEIAELLRESSASRRGSRVPVHVHIAARRGGIGEEVAESSPVETSGAAARGAHQQRGWRRRRADSAADGCGQRSARRVVDVTTEAYPYDAGMTEIQSANLDEYDGASEQRIAQLEWPKTGERLTPDTFQKYRKLGGPVVLHNNTEEMVALAVTSPLTMIASDSYWENGTGHPRTTGTFSRVLGRYVRDARSLTLMDAIRKMTLMPAERLAPRVPAMKTKGRLRQGADADITIFDAARVIDQSTYREPGLPPIGVRHVIVNGVAVVLNDQLVAGVAPGHAIRAANG